MDKILGLIIIMLVIFGCKAKKDLVRKDQVEDLAAMKALDSNTILNNILHSKRDTIFRCNRNPGNEGVLFSFDNLSIEVNTQTYGEVKCYCDGSFKGDVPSLEVLQLLHLNHKRMLCKYYRGTLFFETVLKRSNDFIPVISPESTNHGKTQFETSYRKRIYNMIRTIDGYPPSAYKTLYLANVKGMDDMERLEIFKSGRVRRAQLEYEALLYAWENDLIILKDYGEE